VSRSSDAVIGLVIAWNASTMCCRASGFSVNLMENSRLGSSSIVTDYA
jgi:hypothetical protein